MPAEPVLDAGSLAGRRVLVSGGTRGIGRATARLLAGGGARLMVFARDGGEVDEAVAELRGTGVEAHGAVADVSTPEGIRRVFGEVDRTWGGLDVLVNNAALGAGEVAESTYEEMEYLVRTNLLGYMACAHEAIARMEDGGTIVNVGSMSAVVREKGSSVYVATKAGIEGFSEALRKEVNPRGIRVSLVEPGAVATDMQPAGVEEREAAVERQEMLDPDDIARAVVYCIVQPARSDVVLLRVRPHHQPI